MFTPSQIATFLAEQTRNLFPNGASEELLTRAAVEAEQRRPVKAGDRIRIGPPEHSLQVSRLAMGSGSDGWAGSSNQTRRLGIDGLSRLYLHGYHEHGLNFWETADMYGAHPHLAKALKEVARDEVVVLTKTTSETAEGVRRDIERFQQELATERIDILLLHCMMDGDWPRRMQGPMDVISEAQQRGVVGLKGVSCHSFRALKAARSEPWVEVDLARVNPGGVSMDASPDQVVAVLDDMKAEGKSVLGMKILGNGRFTKPAQLQACIEFALGLSCIDAFTIGFESVDELDQVAALIGGVTGG